MEVTVLKSAGEVASLGDAWNRLTADFDAPTARHDWVCTAIEQLAGSGEVVVVCVFDAGDLVAAAPLIRRRGRLELIGQAEPGEPGGFVYRDAASLHRLVTGIAALRSPLVLDDIVAGSPVVKALRDVGGSRVVVRASSACPSLEIPSEVDEVGVVLSASLRSDLRRAQRRAGEFGEPSFEMHTPTSPEQLNSLWSDVLRVEAAGWKGRSGTALRHDAAVGAFFAAYSRRAMERKELRLGVLDIAGTTAAVMVAAEWDARLWLLKIGFDERYAAASPGLLLLEGAVAHVLGRNLRSLEFLGSAAPWTRRWTQVERPLVTVRSYPYTARGLAALGAAALRSALKSSRRGERR